MHTKSTSGVVLMRDVYVFVIIATEETASFTSGAYTLAHLFQRCAYVTSPDR